MASMQHMIPCAPHNSGLRNVMHSDPVRPNTPSFRIVSTPAVNPSPTFSETFEEEEVLFEDVLSPKKLRQLSGFSDLGQVISLDLVVDTSESSLGSLGTYLPNIRDLRLSGSRICSVRDLGTTLRSLQVLWMSRCGLSDLDGIGSIGQLRELYLAYNDISDVSPLSMVDTLELVDIESNNVDSLDQVEFLCMCPNLSTLSLEGNPVASLLPSAELRKTISSLLPSLKYLDDQPLSGQRTGELATSSHPLLGNTGNLLSEIHVVNTSLKDTIAEASKRPKSAKLDREEVSTPSPTPSPGPGLLQDHSSGLTQGAIVCGPPSKLRTKLSKNVKESAPPTPVGAWSEDPDVMLQEWQASREWLTRELTIDIEQEKRNQPEKRANYEAALRETSRPGSTTRRLSRPTSAARKSPSSPRAGKSRTPTFYDESVEVESSHVTRSHRHSDRTESTRRAERVSLEKGSSRNEKVGERRAGRERRSGSVDRSRVERRREGSSDRRSSKGADTRHSGSKERSKGKERASKTVSSSSEFPVRRKNSVDRSQASASLDSGVLRSPTSPTSPLKAIYRPTSGETAPSRGEIRTLPTPPVAGKGMSSRFRRLKVSIEDQVTQQAAVDVLFSDKMPRPGLSRHTMAVPKAP